MGDSYRNHQQDNKNFDYRREGGMEGRSPGRKDSGGFRIRLSDNEMKSARAIQQAFNLRSIISVLGFSLRTLGQMLEEGKLEDLKAQNKANQSQWESNRNSASNTNRRKNNQEGLPDNKTKPKPNPFARPEKPQPDSQKENKADELEEKDLSKTNSEESSDKEEKSTDAVNNENPINDSSDNKSDT